MSIGVWLRRQIAAIAFATASVEKSLIKDNGKDNNGDGGISQEQSKNQNTLADDLLRGEITQQVKELRWRTFKVIMASEDYKTKYMGFDEDGDVIISSNSIKTPEERKATLKKIKLEPSDCYELEMVVDNVPITIDNLNVFDVAKDATEKDFEGMFTDAPIDPEAVTIGKVNLDELGSGLKQELPILVSREVRGKFEIEKFTKKLYVRKISDNERLLEFFISKYPNADDRRTRLLISEIKKAMINPRNSTLLEINEVEFISYKTMGVKDFHEFHYKITVFDKIVEFDGSYVIKFKAEVLVNGDNILEKYIEHELEEKYKNKEKKK